MNTQLEEALAYDPIAEAEKITGLDARKHNAVAWLGMSLMHKQREEKNALLFLNRDTNSWAQSLEEWTAVIVEMGFEEILCDEIPDTQDKLRIYWRKADGVLLVTDSYNGKSVNSATACFNYRGPRDAMHKTSNGFVKEVDGVEVWAGSRDAREGLRYALDAMTKAGQLLPVWVKRPWLWLLHYNYTKVEGYDYKAITEERISRLPEDVRKAITPE
jgi:hypothetical protein